ncbi:hypothetical protein WJX79_006207 [Trebouxia sp. C0005]
MLYDLEPAREITGGAWYTDQDYDSEFIQVLQTQCFKFIKQEGDPTLEDVSTFIHDKVCVLTRLKAIISLHLNPCGVCPVFNECTPDGPISPATCVYFQQWLEF